MAKATAALAKSLAHRFNMEDGRIQDRDAMRDYADMATGSDLDCTQLDLLSDWMWRHLHTSDTVAPPALGQVSA